MSEPTDPLGALARVMSAQHCGRLYDGPASSPAMKMAQGTACVFPVGHAGPCGNGHGSWPYGQGVEPPSFRERVRPEAREMVIYPGGASEREGILVVEKIRHRLGREPECVFYACGPVRVTLAAAEEDAQALRRWLEQ